jgi:hypothetical protein
MEQQLSIGASFLFIIRIMANQVMEVEIGDGREFTSIQLISFDMS